MTKQVRFMLAMGISVAGTLCFIAGQPRFAYLDSDAARFAGIACFLVAGVFWAAFGLAAGSNRE